MNENASNAALASYAAAESVAQRAATMRQRVLHAIRDAEPRGATDEELQGRLFMNPNTERPRRIELRDAGWVEEGGWGTTRSGRKAVRWRLTEHARKGFGLIREEGKEGQP